jgi:SnoaL-like domain
MSSPAEQKQSGPTDADRAIAALVTRITALEDRAEILNILAGLPHSSDVGNQDYQNDAYHDDCVMDRNDADALVIGKAAIVDIVTSDQHRQAIESCMVHFAGLPHIDIKGARAIATGYLQIVVPVPEGQEAALGGYGPADGFAIWRITANKWELEKGDTGWRVTRRIIRSVADGNFHALIAEGLTGL